MPLIRHVIIKDVELPDLLCGENDLILQDLHTLSRVRNLRLSEVVIKRIRNIKTFKLRYMFDGEAEYHNFGLNNFVHLTKLQSLNLFIHRTSSSGEKALQSLLVHSLSFPHSLKKLTLDGTMLNWEECMSRIGSLPLLQFLSLGRNAFWGSEWETVEGQFCSLKFLQLDCYQLSYWWTDDNHFPCLEHLVLRYLHLLEEIPSCIGNKPTLKSIRLDSCSKSAEDYAKQIKEEQLDLGDTDIQLYIIAAGGEILTTSDALSFVVLINDTFKSQKEIYDGFLDVLKDYSAQRIDADGLKRTVKVLFKEHPNLMLWFNTFFPERYEITNTDDGEAP